MRRRGSGKAAKEEDMRSDTAVIFWVSTVITACVVGGVYYMAVVRGQQTAAQGNETHWTTLKPDFHSTVRAPGATAGTYATRLDGAGGSTNLTGGLDSGQNANPYAAQHVSAETSAQTTPLQRTATPIKCYDPNVGEFWTNAVNCEAADLNNRLSYAAPLATTPYQDRHSGKNYSPPANQAVNSRTDTNTASRVSANQKPDLRRKAKEAPKGLPAECRWPVGDAAELERKMSAKSDPRKSMWLDDYCERRQEVSQLRCPLPGDFFWYSYSQLCRTARR